MTLINFIKSFFKPAPVKPENMKRKDELREALIGIVETYLEDAQAAAGKRYYETVLEQIKEARTMRELLAIERVVDDWIDR